MAYFPNGSAGMQFVATNCDYCAQWKERDGYPGAGEGCPVYDAHILNPGKDHEGEFHDLLQLLIQDTDGEGKRAEPTCHMYTPISAAREAERNGQLRFPTPPQGEQ